MTISHDDLPYVNNALQHLIKCGIHNIDVNPVLEDVWSEGDEVIFENELKKFAEYMVKHPLRDKLIITCFDGTIGHPLGKSNRVNPCGIDMLTIDAKGNFYTCLRFAAFSLREKPARAIGNIDTGININLLRPYLVVSPDVMLRGEKCIDCDIATGCKYCPAENYDASISDTIFERSIGRTDLGGGDYDTLIDSIRKKVLTLPDETMLHPGHGSSTVVEEERKYNPFLREK
jgi:radical SAM protein with 4Fe4S-binding SPASM domain